MVCVVGVGKLIMLISREVFVVVVAAAAAFFLAGVGVFVAFCLFVFVWVLFIIYIYISQRGEKATSKDREDRAQAISKAHGNAHAPNPVDQSGATQNTKRHY